MRPRLSIGAGLLALALAAAPGVATTTENASAMPEELREVGFDQKLGAQLPLDTVFSGRDGVRRPLGEFFGERPVVLALVYYDCPMLCDMVMNGVVASLRAIEFTVGGEFDVVAVSFDPTETPELAREKGARYIESYGRSEDGGGWSFLTGEPESIRRLTDSVGFRYVYDEETGEFAHAAGIVVATPEGSVSRYFYGIDFPPRDLRLGLVDAAAGTIGSALDQVLLFCFHYDPMTGQYNFAALTAVRVGGVLTVAALAAFIVTMLRRERRQRPTLEAKPTL